MKEITLKLKREEVELILTALSKLPLEVSFKLFTSVQNEAIEQLKETEATDEQSN